MTRTRTIPQDLAPMVALGTFTAARRAGSASALNMSASVLKKNIPEKTISESATEDPRLALARRIAFSHRFARSPLLTRFLLYIVEETLAGRTARLTEHPIGVVVFARPRTYRTEDDNIVRNYARQLRRRLEEYFANEGRDEPLLLSIPTGGYIPVFRPRAEAASPHEPESAPPTAIPSTEPTAKQETRQESRPENWPPETGLKPAAETDTPALPHKPLPTQPQGAPAAAKTATDTPATDATRQPHPFPPRRRWPALRLPASLVPSLTPGLLTGLLVGLFAGLSASLILLRLAPEIQPQPAASPSNSRQTFTSAVSPAHALWAQLFSTGSFTSIVPSDAGFNLLEDFANSTISLDDYMQGLTHASQSLRSVNAQTSRDLTTQQFTDFASAQIVGSLLRLPEFPQLGAAIRFPRNLRIDDLREGNGILIGSLLSNPWSALIDSRLNFRIVPLSGMRGALILNLAPRPGEATRYHSHWNEARHDTWGIIALERNLSGKGWILLLEGLDVAGTQSAADFLFGSPAIAAVLQQARLPDGTLAPFEILLHSTSLDSHAAGVQVVAMRFGESATEK